MSEAKKTLHVMQAAQRAVWAERMRQIGDHGFDARHDDAHRFGELALAAASYILTDFGVSVLTSNVVAGLVVQAPGNRLWPWQVHEFKATPSRMRNLVKACALLEAELERELRKSLGVDVVAAPGLPPDVALVIDRDGKPSVMIKGIGKEDGS